MSWVSTVGAGVARVLAAAGVCQWDEDGLYDPGTVGAFVCAMPDQPGDAVSIWPTPFTPTLGSTQARIQVRARRDNPDPRDTADLAQAVIDALHGARSLTFGDVTVTEVLLSSQADMGPDAAGRPEVSLNFTAWATYPAPLVRNT